MSTAAVGLLSSSQEGTGELAYKVSTATVTAALLVVTHEGIHGKTPKPTGPIASRTVAHASSPIAGFGALGSVWLMVGVGRLSRRAAVRAAANGRFTGGEVPLRHAGANLDVVILLG